MDRESQRRPEGVLRPMVASEAENAFPDRINSVSFSPDPFFSPVSLAL